MIPVKPYIPTRDDQLAAEDLDDEGFYDRPSKSQKKRDVEALQALGVKLAELSSEQLKKIEMPEELRAALREAQRIAPRSEAMRRQMQFVGKLMRKVDPAPLQAALDRIAGLSAIENMRMHKRENLRERFLADESVIAEITQLYPEADIQQLRQLRRNALREQENKKPPHAFREIYRVLRDLEEAKLAAPMNHNEDES